MAKDLMTKEAVEGYRLSPQQQRLWKLQQIDESRAYRVQCSVIIEGALDVESLRLAVGRVVERHEILRTRFQHLPGSCAPLQAINEDAQPSWRSIDLTKKNAEAQGRIVERIFQEELQRAFDLTRSSLLRVSLLKLSADAHVLIISLHALCADAASLQNLIGEIVRSYGDHLRGVETLGEPTQYLQFSEWQNELLNEEAAEQARNYWRGQESATADNVAFDFEIKHAAERSFKPSTCVVEIAGSVLAEVERYVSVSDCSINDFSLTCWRILLRRLLGADEIVLGVMYDARRYEELQDALGLFTKWLPLRNQFDGSFRFQEVLDQLRRFKEAADDWGEYFVWETIDDGLGNAGGGASFGFESLQEPARHTIEDTSFTMSQRYICTERFKIKLSCTALGNSLRAELHYDASLFKGEDIERLARAFEALFEDAARHPQRQIRSLHLLTPVERQWIIELNDTHRLHPLRHFSIPQLFERQVDLTPDAPALIFAETELSYAQLNAEANQLAHLISAHGIGHDAIVALSLPRSSEMVIALLAILKAGAAYLPLEPDYPPERLSFMLKDAGASLLLTLSSLRERFAAALSGTALPVIALDQHGSEIQTLSSANPPPTVEPLNLAYVIYTSGSTGQPKAAMNTHQAITNRLLWMQSAFNLSSADAVLQKTPFSFDVSVWEFFWPLMVGARLVLARPGGQADPQYLCDLIAQRQITTMHFVPSMLRVFLETGQLSKCESLQRVISSGEALTAELKERFRGRMGCGLYNLYGPTEAAVDVSWFECQAEQRAEASVPIGRPIWNVRLYILDEQQQLLPVGVSGELYISGVALGRGYLRRPELTAEKFVPDPHSTEAGARMYRTGDVGRYRGDGVIEYLGRMDEQVKIRGYRVELGEIESELLKVEGIEGAVVVARRAEGGEQQLVAYVVTGGAEVEVGRVREELRGRVPEYMIPGVYVRMERLPETASGKVDRRRLPALDEARGERVGGGQQYLAPRSLVEELVAEIWSDVLRVERVGVHDNFFDLGGHSLLAMQVVIRLRNTFYIDVPADILFRAPTLEKLSRALIEIEERPGQTEKIAVISKRVRAMTPEDAKATLENIRTQSKG